MPLSKLQSPLDAKVNDRIFRGTHTHSHTQQLRGCMKTLSVGPVCCRGGKEEGRRRSWYRILRRQNKLKIYLESANNCFFQVTSVSFLLKNIFMFDRIEISANYAYFVKLLRRVSNTYSHLLRRFCSFV